jgi:hypothetical protein
MFRLPEGCAARVEAVVYWWRVSLLPPSDDIPTPHEDTAAYIKQSGASGVGAPAVLCTQPAMDWMPREHWWQACCVLPSAIVLTGVEERLRLVAAHNDTSVWFEPGTDATSVAERGEDEARAMRTQAPPQLVGGQWRCSCGLHAEWSAHRLVQLADAARQERFRDALRSTLADCVGRQQHGAAQQVVLAFGVWIGVQAARMLRSLQQSQGDARLRICVIEGSFAARRLARNVLAQQQPRFPSELIELCDADWGRFILNPAQHLLGQHIAAVVAEPWFRGVGNSWGPVRNAFSCYLDAIVN